MNTQTKFIAALLLIVVAAGPGYPQNKQMLQLEADMIELTARVKQLQATVDQNDAAIKGLVEKMTDQVGTIAGGMQKLSQAVDQVDKRGDSSTRELRATLTSINNAMTEIRDDLTSMKSQVSSISKEITTLKTTETPLAGPNDLWRTAMLDSYAGNYDLAIGGFNEFLSKFPSDPRAAQATLLIAESFYGQKKFEQAAIQYDLVLQKYPDSDTTRTALLKKGLAQAELNQTQLAAVTLQEVITRFPKTAEASTAEARLKEIKPAAPPRRPGQRQ